MSSFIEDNSLNQDFLNQDALNQNVLNQDEFQNENLLDNQISNQMLDSENIYDSQNLDNSQNITPEDNNQDLLNSENAIMAISSNDKKLTSKTGYFYIEISGNGKTTKRLIKVELGSTDMTKQQTVKFTEASVSEYKDNHNFQISTLRSKTQKTGDYYTILTMEFTYTKPAHYMANGEYLNKVDGYRFNFKKYSLDNSGNSTVNNTGHNVSDITETINLQINVANCGINQSTNQYDAKNSIGIIKLSQKYYSSLKIDPNGGVHRGNKSLYKYGTVLCGYADKIENPTRQGYRFMEWTLSKGNYCKGANFDASANMFTYCGKSTSASNVSSDNTCVLKANWELIYGSVTIKILDEQNNSLKNGIFSLYDCNGNLKQKIDSGQGDEVRFENLLTGSYMIYEEKIQEGYELIKINAIKVEITENNTNIELKLNHKRKLMLPEAGGISKELGFVLVGMLLVIVFIKKGGINE